MPRRRGRSRGPSEATGVPCRSPGSVDVKVSFRTFYHAWHGEDDDPTKGNHAPEPPYTENKTLFPRRWFGDENALDYPQAEDTIREAILHGQAQTPQLDRPGVWKVGILHDNVMTKFVIRRDGTVRGFWPEYGEGVMYVVSVDPLVLVERRTPW